MSSNLTGVHVKHSIDVVNGDQIHAPFIYHIVHPLLIHWTTVLDGLQAAGMIFDRVSQAVWLDKVEASPDDPVMNPSKQMLSMWKAAVSAS